MESLTRLQNILNDLYTDDIILVLYNIMEGKSYDICKFRITYGDIIDNLRNKKILKRSSQLLLCEYYIDEFDQSQYPCTYLYNIGSLKKEFNSNSVLRTLKIDDINKNEYQKYLELHDVPTSFALDFIPWQEVLSFHVNIDNVNLIKPEIFIAVIIKDITYYGTSESIIEYEKKHMLQSRSKVKFPLDNGTGHNCIFTSNDDDFSMIPDDNDHSLEWVLTNKINEYNMVYNYWHKPYQKYLKNRKKD